jgi:hypothetical protein
MPILVYTPEGADPIEWDFDFDRLPGPEVAAMEEAAGCYYDEMRVAFFSGSWSVRRVVAWVLMRRMVPGLTLAAFTASPHELPNASFNLVEARRYVEQFGGDPDEDDKAQIESLFERFGDAIYRKDDLEVSDPKG